MLSNANLTQEERNLYNSKLNNIIQTFKLIEGERNKRKAEKCKEVKESNLTLQRLDELTKSKTDNEFYREENNRLDSIINSGYDSLADLKKQDVLLSDINSKLKTGMARLGMSADLMEKIEKRTLGDKTFFYFMVIFIVFMMFIIKFMF